MEFIADLQMIPMLRGGRLPLESLSAVEKHLLGLVDGKRNVEELGFECGFDAQMAGRMVGKLLMAGILEESRLSKSISEVSSSTDGSSDGSAPVKSTKPKRGDETTQSVTEAVVLELYGKLDKLNHYELLGVAPVAARSDIRAAYFSLSKKFHPDTRYLDSSAELKKKLSRIFDKLTTAYETLSGKSKRQAYDDSISDVIELWKLEHSLKQSVASIGHQNANGSSAPRGNVRERNRDETDSSRGAASVQPKKPVSSGYRRMPVQDDVPVQVGARVSRIPVTRSSYTSELRASAAPLSEGRGPASGAGGRNRNDDINASPTSRHSIPASGTLSPKEREARREQWKQDRLKKAMRQGNVSPDMRKVTGGYLTASEMQLIEKARIAMEHHEFDMAIENIHEVLRRDGENRLASQLLRQAQSGKIKSDINELIRKGRFEQSRGNHETALELYESAYKLDNRDLEAKFHIAAILLEMRRDLRKAAKLCQEVIGMGGRKPQYYVTLAELCEQTGDRARAVESMQHAVKLSPDDRDLKKRLRTMMRK